MPDIATKGFPLFLADNIILESGKTLEDIIASARKASKTDKPVKIVRNARRHRWEVYLKE